jgi:hypothetical protein
MRRILAMAVVASLTLFLLAPRGRADEPCANQVEYAVSGDLQITETTLGEGNGVFPSGPGRVVLRFDGTNVKMTTYAMREHVVVTAKNIGFKTTVTSDTQTTATPDACGVVAEGTLDGDTVRWRTPARGMKTDGTMTCAGSFCGKLGAPPHGQSTYHDGPLDIRFSPFVMSADRKSFTMAMTHMSKTSMPKQSAAMSFAGHESKRACVPPPACR